ncbi:hypothetical protein LOTGIDRAFT_173662 [Lottia gigantea]|uniref:Uncharacterized protein n=1 Tax=Lottia gigantea TaxID=225164 RepID=V4CCM6_LOTGI|nr:hypothetical protein LOTGIDRAFT_173662 [Lottia gigantea]ESO99654.1 hypothetical protein LOTGIDRAFT_173662 [Lottia gigantea]
MTDMKIVTKEILISLGKQVLIGKHCNITNSPCSHRINQLPTNVVIKEPEEISLRLHIVMVIQDLNIQMDIFTWQVKMDSLSVVLFGSSPVVCWRSFGQVKMDSLSVVLFGSSPVVCWRSFGQPEKFYQQMVVR